jgi:hypothetical protein
MRKDVTGFLVIIFLGAALTMVHWALLVIAGIVGGYVIEDTKKSFYAFVAGILAWSLFFVRYVLSGYFGAVTSFVNAVAGLPALPLTLAIGGILALLGALVGGFLKKIFAK